MVGRTPCPKERKFYKMKRSLRSRIFSGLLALVMILTMLPMGISAGFHRRYLRQNVCKLL